jgi:terminase large subunit-like protein
MECRRPRGFAWPRSYCATRLQAQGASVIEFRQTVANFSEPTKQLDALVRSGKIGHDNDPVLAWMIGNVVGHYDAKENVYARVAALSWTQKPSSHRAPHRAVRSD